MGPVRQSCWMRATVRRPDGLRGIRFGVIRRPMDKQTDINLTLFTLLEGGLRAG
jgi:hypothetical protein